MKVQIQGNKSARYQDTWLSLLMNCSSYSNTPPIEHKFCAAKNLFCQVHHLNYFVMLATFLDSGCGVFRVGTQSFEIGFDTLYYLSFFNKPCEHQSPWRKPRVSHASPMAPDHMRFQIMEGNIILQRV